MSAVEDDRRAAGTQTPPVAQPTRTSADNLRRLAGGALLAGRYRIREFIGIGGMGIVYRAHDEQLDLDVALKVLRPDFSAAGGQLDRFRRELILARQVTHRNVVRIHDLGQDGEIYFITMDFVHGRSLRELLAQERRLAAERTVPIIRQLAAGLEAAHQEGIIHRDLKPANILVDETGRAYITDFGVARSLTGAGLTRDGAILGTPDYLSPEQARGEQVDGRSDLYALGIVLFELLSGELPFRGESYSEILAQRLTGRTKDLTKLGIAISPQLKAVVRRCLERDPQRRYQSAKELLADLEALDSKPKRGGWRVAVAAAALLALALLGWFAAQGWFGFDRLAKLVPAARPKAGVAGTYAVVVLPFVNETGREDLAWTSTGLAEMLAEALAESTALRVVGNFRLLRALEDLKLGSGPLSDPDLRQIAELFEADRVVTARVRWLDDRLRVDAHLLARERPGELAATPLPPVTAAIQNFPSLCAQLSQTIRARLEIGSPAVAPTFAATPEALQAYSEGVKLLLRGEALAAEPLLRRAVSADPNFTAAWLRLAEAEQSLGYSESAREASTQAVSKLGGRKDRMAYEARAQQALLDGEPQRAQQILVELVGRYPNDIEAALKLAEAYGSAGDLGSAVQVLKEVVVRDPANPRGWYLLSKYSILSGNGREAVDNYLVRALVLQNKLRSQQGKADVLNAFGVAYRELGELDQASENYRQAAELRRQIGDLRGYATTLRNLGGIYLVRGDHAAAESNLNAALKILEQIGDRAGIADVLNDSGVLEEGRGQYAAALDHYRRALKLRRELGDQRTVGESLNNVGYAYYLLGQYDNAVVYWQQALDLFKRNQNTRGVVLSTQNLGLLRLAQGDWDAAAKSFLTALEQSRAAGLESSVAVSLGYLGRLAQWQGRYPAALASYSDALKILERLGDQRGQVEFTLAQAETFLELGLRSEVARRLDQVGGRLEGSGNHEQLAELLRLRGELYREQRQIAAAARQYQEALREAQASHAILELLSARLGSAIASLASSDTGSAFSELQKIESEAQQIGHALLRLRSLEALANANLARGQLSQAESAVTGALRIARRCGSYGGSYRLHLLRSKILSARGAAAESQRELAQAAEELQRVRGQLAADQQRGFDQIEEVREIVRQTTRPERRRTAA